MSYACLNAKETVRICIMFSLLACTRSRLNGRNSFFLTKKARKQR